jgi:hypothetical protein
VPRHYEWLFAIVHRARYFSASYVILLFNRFMVSTPGGTVAWINIGMAKSPCENFTAIIAIQRLAVTEQISPRTVGFHLPAIEHAGKIIFSVWSSRLWIDLNRSGLQGHLPGSSNCRCKRFRVRNGAKGTSSHN